MEGGRRFNTRAVHEGEIVDTRYGNVGTPIFEVSTFLYPPNEDSSAVIDDTTGKPFLYTRIGNPPTLQALERKYASLEGTDRGLSFSSGMNAIFTCLLSVASKAPGSWPSQNYTARPGTCSKECCPGTASRQSL